MERELLLQCERLKEGNDTRVENITDECHKAENRLHEMHAQFATSKDQATRLFIKAKNSTFDIKEIDQKLCRVGDGSSLQVIQFKKSTAINDMMSKSSPLGKIETSDIRQLHSKARTSFSDLSPVKNKDIDIKTSSDRGKSMISGIAKVNKEMIACTDWNNYKVKLVDIKRSVIKDEITLASPYDLTCIPDDQLAVTLCSDKQIQFLSTRGGLSKGHTLSVNGECRGIAYSKDRLYVTYEKDPKVEIMTFGGDVLQCFKYDPSGKPLFAWPLYVAVSNDASFMYISDSSLLSRSGSVIKFSSNGKVQATYTGLPYPRKLAVCEDGSVLVCDSYLNNLQLLSPECTKVKDVFGKSEDVRGCWAVCYDDQTNTLYLGFSEGKGIQVYTMK